MGITPVIGAGAERVIHLQSSLVYTDYEEKLRFYIPQDTGEVMLKIVGYKPTDLTLQHNHGSHRHGLKVYADTPYPRKCYIEPWHTFYSSITHTTVGSGRGAVNASYPEGLTARINGYQLPYSYGNGFSDVVSNWINITNIVIIGDINTIEFKASTPGCKAMAIIKY